VILSLWKDRHPAKRPKAARKSSKKN